MRHVVVSWLSGNDRRHGKTPIDLGAAVEWALEAFFQLFTTNQSSIESGIQQTARWTPPEQGTLKINPDEAFLHETCTGATGAMVRGILAEMAIS